MSHPPIALATRHAPVLRTPWFGSACLAHATRWRPDLIPAYARALAFCSATSALRRPLPAAATKPMPTHIESRPDHEIADAR